MRKPAPLLPLLALLAGCAAPFAAAADRTAGAAGAASHAGGPGAVMIGGGALSNDNEPLWRAFMARVPRRSGRAPRVAVLGSARPDLAHAREAYEAPDGYAALFRRYGAEPFFVPVAIDTYRTAAADPALARAVSAASAIFLGGGAQDLHARCLRNDDGSDSPLLAAIRRAHAQGAVVAGTSAGAAVLAGTAYGGGDSAGYLAAGALTIHPFSALPLVAYGTTPGGGGTHPGLGFTQGLALAIDTHADARGRYGRALVASRSVKADWGVAVGEDTAAWLTPAHRLAIVGAGPVLAFDARGAAPAYRAWTLASGDRLDLRTGRAAWSTASAPAAPWPDALWRKTNLLTALHAAARGGESRTLAGVSLAPEPGAVAAGPFSAGPVRVTLPAR